MASVLPITTAFLRLADWGASDVEKHLLAATEVTLVSSHGHGNGTMALKTLQRLSVALRVKPQPLSRDFKTPQDHNGPSRTFNFSQTDFLLILQTSFLPCLSFLLLLSLSPSFPVSTTLFPLFGYFSCSALHFSG